MKHRASIVACARWETPYITEWLLYHQSIGFDHVYLYCNDDDPADLYAQVLPFTQGHAPFVTFHHYPFVGQQFRMYMHCLRHHRTESQWITFIDIDEFLALRGSDDIQRFLDAVPRDWHSVYFNWIFFGNNGFAERPPGSVLLQYDKRAAAVHPSTKTMTRTDAIDPAQIERNVQLWHHWSAGVTEPFVARNVVGHPIEAYLAGPPETYLRDPAVQDAIMGRAVLYHYAFRSERDFMLRYERGVAADFAGQTMWKRVFESGQYRQVLAELNAQTDTYLADYWRAFLARAQKTSVVRRPELPNLALGKPADQSSVSEWSREPTTRADAAGGVSGRVTGTHQFHTESEDRPWWRVDLGAPSNVREIWVYNRIDDPSVRDRCLRFVLQASEDGRDWRDVHEKRDDRPFGGADGAPYVAVLDPPAPARHVRLVKTERNYLHLDQIEVYGTCATAQADR